jgi:succinyl-CoA synthetase beta subunit
LNVHEYQAKQILAKHGVPVPEGEVASTPDEARAIADRLGGTVVVKAQVLVGGRGKAGGVKLAANRGEAFDRASDILGMSIKGITVRKVLVGRAVDIKREIYLGAILDRAAKAVTLMASAEGGVEIEEVARVTPEKILRVTIDPYIGLADYQARELAFALGIERARVRDFVGIAKALHAALIATDGSLFEINPLAVLADGSIAALDAKLVLDDSALYRHTDLELLRDTAEEEPAEVAARAAGLSYVRLTGSIGCVVNGAGLAMATMDVVKLHGGDPANFLDIGGGARADRVSAALRILFGDPQVRVILFNIFGGITRCDEVASGIVAALAEAGESVKGVPIVVRLVGTNEAEGRRILAEAGLIAVTSMDEAAKAAVAALAKSARQPEGATK